MVVPLLVSRSARKPHAAMYFSCARPHAIFRQRGHCKSSSAIHCDVLFLFVFFFDEPNIFFRASKSC